MNLSEKWNYNKNNDKPKNDKVACNKSIEKTSTKNDRKEKRNGKSES